jgi:hypothetical protein
METREYKIFFEDCTPADSARLVQELEDELREAAPSARISLEKDRADSQDLGSTLVLVLGTPVAITLAHSLGAFLRRHSGASITITRSGEVVGKNLDSSDAAKIAEAFGVKRPS